MKRLIAKAKEARKKAYAPYSKFKVGAALETADGKIYTGCNVENAAYSPTVCAERTAVLKAVSEGARRFKRIAVVADCPSPCPPCGVCRQTLLEFSPDMEVVMANLRGRVRVRSVGELMPDGFRFKRRP